MCSQRGKQKCSPNASLCPILVFPPLLVFVCLVVCSSWCDGSLCVWRILHTNHPSVERLGSDNALVALPSLPPLKEEEGGVAARRGSSQSWRVGSVRASQPHREKKRQAHLNTHTNCRSAAGVRSEREAPSNVVERPGLSEESDIVRSAVVSTHEDFLEARSATKVRSLAATPSYLSIDRSDVQNVLRDAGNRVAVVPKVTLEMRAWDSEELKMDVRVDSGWAKGSERKSTSGGKMMSSGIVVEDTGDTRTDHGRVRVLRCCHRSS